ncbi:Gfo/Idh/MocA family protein [Roseobacter weihaiensis]|uniref:Gfo/Idh/MocA family protein n=1 Tax=Roseobacter weihaiensis TaxID=2763262 RepID=UPI001D09FD44|nr:Gfo/Idh/MocA family oxidoreductase [Roseobacter sp. H9]
MIRVAILGAGIGREHLNAYRLLPEAFSVVLIVDQDENRAMSLKESDGFLVSTDISDALRDPSIDIMDICLPPHLHVPVALKALVSGKHVICEKPIATSLRDVDQLEAAAAKHRRNLYPVFQYRFGPPLAQLRRLIDEGFAGHPQIATVETHWSRDAAYYAVPWRGTWTGEQGGAILSHAIHAHDLITHFMGPVSAVSGFATTRVNPIETEDCAALSFEMENGALATSNITLGAAGNETRLRFVFENLTATSSTAPYAPGMQPWVFEARSPGKQPVVDQIVAETPPEDTGFKGFLTEVAKNMSDAPNNAVTLQDGAASVMLVTAIYDAVRTGARVTLPLDAQHPLYKGWLP